MSWDRVESDWLQFTGKVKKRWGDLTDDDLAQAAGRREEFSRRLQARYGIERDVAEDQIDDWLREPGVLDDWNDRKPILDM
jgi:uncharacterized protein YjbJ (UPF0337 family)